MKIRKQRVSVLGARLVGAELDLSLHEYREPEKTASHLEVQAFDGLVEIEGSKLRVIREWSEAMGYVEQVERVVASMGDGIND